MNRKEFDQQMSLVCEHVESGRFKEATKIVSGLDPEWKHALRSTMILMNVDKPVDSHSAEIAEFNDAVFGKG